MESLESESVVKNEKEKKIQSFCKVRKREGAAGRGIKKGGVFGVISVVDKIVSYKTYCYILWFLWFVFIVILIAMLNLYI